MQEHLERIEITKPTDETETLRESVQMFIDAINHCGLEILHSTMIQSSSSTVTALIIFKTY